MPISQTGDVLTQIAARSTATVKFSTTPLPKGTYGVYRNGVKVYDLHLVTHPPAGGSPTVKSGTATDANPTGAQLVVTDNNGVSAKVDAAQFINSLR